MNNLIDFEKGFKLKNHHTQTILDLEHNHF